MLPSLGEVIMQLSNQTDSEILEGLTNWVRKEREAASHVLYYLREVEERQLHLRYATSLFEFCVKVYKYSRHEAQIRVDAMRLLKKFPEVGPSLNAGKLSLTVAAQAQSAFRREDTRRAAAGQLPLSIAEQKTVLADLISASTREAERRLVAHFPEVPAPERTKPVTHNLTRIEFNSPAQLTKKLERLQAVYSHQTAGSWEKLFEILADHEIIRLDAPPRRAPGLKKGSRHISKPIHQDVWSNWEQGCDHILEDGERCGSKRNLQTDHIHEFARGGTNARENLRLLCGAHNRYRSDRLEVLRRDFMARMERQRKIFLESLSI